jgi:Ca2+-transporting ATPase
MDELIRQLDADTTNGLTSGEASRRLKEFGLNKLAEAPSTPAWRKILAHFSDTVILILIVAVVISALLGEWIDAAAILAIVLLNGFISFFQEERAERALLALQELASSLVKVIRDGTIIRLEPEHLVPGDLLDLDAGDSIPADARLISAYGVTVQEAALTGESLPVSKSADGEIEPSAPVGDRRNMVHMGTVVAAGKARAVITATGMRTELGQIAGLLQRHEPGPTPLQRRLQELGRILIVLCVGIVALIFLLQWLRDKDLTHAFLMAVSLAVAAVPEGLPAVVTVSLALGLQRMVRRNALVRKLPSVETLGTVTVICSDKTGTLTKNEMTVQEIWADDHRYSVSGVGYLPVGEFREDGRGPLPPPAPHVLLDVDGPSASLDNALDVALRIGAWCNNAQVTPPSKGGGDWKVVGDPTEAALIVAALKRQLPVRTGTSKIRFEIPFDSTRKMMSAMIQQTNGEPILYTKGAAESLLSRCQFELRGGRVTELTPARREQILNVNASMAKSALRVLALGFRSSDLTVPTEELEAELVFVGLVGMIDPPREEARPAVLRCRSAGIRPVMITGDHPATAAAIATSLGILGPGDQLLTGRELEQLDDSTLEDRVEQISVYARASAEHKLRVIQALRARGEVVAMTGDGVNDAPAIKAADIGIAMGITGTDVTKEAADMVLTDDNFVSIVAAVEEGRGIYDNIQKVLQFLLSCNTGEILLMLVASLLGWPAPLLPIQLLWINLVTDGFPALALSLEPPEPGIMRRKPRAKKSAILDYPMACGVLFQGVLVAAVSLTAFGLSYFRHPTNVEQAQAMAFCVLVYAELLRAVSARSRSLPVFKLGFFTNPYLLLAVLVSGLLQLSVTVAPFAQPIFGVSGHSGLEWFEIAFLAALPMVVIESQKWLTSLGDKGPESDN